MRFMAYTGVHSQSARLAARLICLKASEAILFDVMQSKCWPLINTETVMLGSVSSPSEANVSQQYNIASL